MVTQIEQMLVEAWRKFCDYYDTRAPRFKESWPVPLDVPGARESHWICWDEYDLTFHIGRFFYDILKEKKESLFSDIEVHFEKSVDQRNFSGYGYKFENELEKLRNQLEGWPKVDLIAAYENRPCRFLLCAEVKCFRYNGTPIQEIDEDIRKLIVIRDLGIAKKVVFILFDDYYWCNDEKTANKIQQRLNEIQQDGITVLFHTSKAKLENYPDC
jgi:hypothetical protein